MNINVPTVTLSGQYRCVVSTDSEGNNVTKDTGWFDNLITDTGLDAIGLSDGDDSGSFSGNILDFFRVGSGSTPPQPTDTSLVTEVAAVEVDTSERDEVADYPAGYNSLVNTSQFAEGVAAGNLSEIGMGGASSLFSRALIVDGAGNPTTITVLANEFLTVFYTLRVNIPKGDVVTTLDVDIDGTLTSHTITMRPMDANDWKFSAAFHTGIRMKAMSATLGAETSSPAGGGFSTSISIPSYSPGTYIKSASYTWGLTEANYASGINVFSGWTPLSKWQFSIDPALNKDNTKSLEVTVSLRYAREGEL